MQLNEENPEKKTFPLFISIFLIEQHKNEHFEDA